MTLCRVRLVFALTFPIKFRVFFRIIHFFRVEEAEKNSADAASTAERQEVKVRATRAIESVAFVVLKTVPVRDHVPRARV